MNSRARKYLYFILVLHLHALDLSQLLLLLPNLSLLQDVLQKDLARLRLLPHCFFLNLKLLVQNFYLLRSLHEFGQPSTQPVALVQHKLVLLLQKFGVGADKVQVVLWSDVVDSAKLLEELLAVVAHGEVDVDHMVNDGLAVLVWDQIILNRHTSTYIYNYYIHKPPPNKGDQSFLSFTERLS